MDGYLLDVLGDVGVHLRVIADGRRVVVRHGYPGGLARLDHHALGLHRAGVGVDDYVLDEAGDIAVVPAGVAEGIGLLARPGGKGVGAVVGPGPEAGRLPALGHADADRDHLLPLRQRRRAQREQADERHKDSKQLFHFLTSVFTF